MLEKFLQNQVTERTFTLNGLQLQKFYTGWQMSTVHQLMTEEKASKHPLIHTCKGTTKALA